VDGRIPGTIAKLGSTKKSARDFKEMIDQRFK
jgi:hypothetical protein